MFTKTPNYDESQKSSTIIEANDVDLAHLLK